MTTIKQVIPVPKDTAFYAVYKHDDGTFSADQIFFFALIEDIDEEDTSVYTCVEGLIFAEGRFEQTGDVLNCIGVYPFNEMREKFTDIDIR